MIQFETTYGTRKVITTSNDGSSFSSRLYVNNGETATLKTGKHKSAAGARQWAVGVLGGVARIHAEQEVAS